MDLPVAPPEVRARMKITRADGTVEEFDVDTELIPAEDD